MPKLSPIKAERLMKILLKLGFEKIRQKGSHLFLKHPDGKTTIIPIHKGEEIGRGLLRKILRDTNLSPEEFEKLK